MEKKAIFKIDNIRIRNSIPNNYSKICDFYIINKIISIQTNENFTNFGIIESFNLNTHQNTFFSLLKKERMSVSSVKNRINPHISNVNDKFNDKLMNTNELEWDIINQIFI